MDLLHGLVLSEGAALNGNLVGDADEVGGDDAVIASLLELRKAALELVDDSNPKRS